MSLELLSNIIFSTYQQYLVVHVSVFGSRRGGLSVANHPFLEQSTKKHNIWGNKWKYVRRKNLMKPTNHRPSQIGMLWDKSATT